LLLAIEMLNVRTKISWAWHWAQNLINMLTMIGLSLTKFLFVNSDKMPWKPKDMEEAAVVKL
jgi:hypothetical protein